MQLQIELCYVFANRRPPVVKGHRHIVAPVAHFIRRVDIDQISKFSGVSQTVQSPRELLALSIDDGAGRVPLPRHFGRLI